MQTASRVAKPYLVRRRMLLTLAVVLLLELSAIVSSATNHLTMAYCCLKVFLVAHSPPQKQTNKQTQNKTKIKKRATELSRELPEEEMQMTKECF